MGSQIWECSGLVGCHYHKEFPAILLREKAYEEVSDNLVGVGIAAIYIRCENSC